MTGWWWVQVYLYPAVVGTVLGLVSAVLTDRRRRRRERRHEIRLRLVDGNGLEWVNSTCHALSLARRYGGQDDPPWMTIETFEGGKRLQIAPAHLD
jgi:hypothetical protein